jgi:hypothetical protein
MSPVVTPAPSRDRLERFRGLRARLDPTGAPEDAMEVYVDAAGSVSTRIAAELSLAPSSTHLLIGGVGSGKTTQLLAARKLVSQIHDTRALYIDVSKRHDIAKMVPGVIAVQVGLALDKALAHFGMSDLAKKLHEIAHGYRAPREPDSRNEQTDSNRYVPGILVSPEPLAERVEQSLQPLADLLDLSEWESSHLVVMLDGLDRMTDMTSFEQLVIHDVKALSSLGIGVVLIGPLRVLYGLDRTISERFDSLHYQPWLDVKQGPDSRMFLHDVLRKRVPEQAFSDLAIDELVFASGGVLRDLLTLSQAACVETYLGGTERVEGAQVAAAVNMFGRKHLQGLRPAELEVLQRVRTNGSFVQTSEDDLALLMTRRVLEYRKQGQPRYEVHPAIEKLLEELAG